MLHRRWRTLVILHRAHARVKVESLPQRHIQRTHAAAHGRGQWTFDCDAKFANRIHSVIWQPIIELGLGFLAREYFIPGDPTLALVSFLYSGIEYAHRRFPDVPAGAIALNEGNNGIVRHLVAPVAVADPGAVRGHRKAVV